MGLSLVKFWYHEQQQEIEENTDENSDDIVDEVEDEKDTEEQPQQSSHIYTIMLDNHVLGYKTSWLSAQRFAKRIMKEYSISLPLGSHRYWWRKQRSTSTSTTYMLQSLAFNYLMKAPRVEATLTISQVSHIDSLQPMSLQQYTSNKHKWSFLHINKA